MCLLQSTRKSFRIKRSITQTKENIDSFSYSNIYCNCNCHDAIFKSWQRHGCLMWHVIQWRGELKVSDVYETNNQQNSLHHYHQHALTLSEASLQRCFLEKVFWKYAANLQENTHAKVRFHRDKYAVTTGMVLLDTFLTFCDSHILLSNF